MAFRHHIWELRYKEYFAALLQPTCDGSYRKLALAKILAFSQKLMVVWLDVSLHIYTWPLRLDAMSHDLRWIFKLAKALCTHG